MTNLLIIDFYNSLNAIIDSNYTEEILVNKLSKCIAIEHQLFSSVKGSRRSRLLYLNHARSEQPKLKVLKKTIRYILWYREYKENKKGYKNRLKDRLSRAEITSDDYYYLYGIYKTEYLKYRCLSRKVLEKNYNFTDTRGIVI